MPTDSGPASSPPERRALLETATLSVSGWRGRWGRGVELPCQAPSPQPVAPAVRDFVALAVDRFLTVALRYASRSDVRIAVATDTRPTGPAIADVAVRALLSRGIAPVVLGVCPTPQLLAYVASDVHVAGFICITASHNPLEYNGIKFGLGDGAVLAAASALPLIDEVRAAFLDDSQIAALVNRIARLHPNAIERAFAGREAHASAAATAYREFVLRTVSGIEAREEREREFDLAVQQALVARPLGVVGELNGSARCLGIERSLLPEMGLRTAWVNDVAGTFAHQILPEGEGLADAAAALVHWRGRDDAFRVAYVPDNDGDRGNLVFLGDDGDAMVLEAQEVFALVCAIELAWARYRGADMDRVCIVANGPTSERIERIAGLFGATVFRCEVGEANVVARAAAAVAAGYRVALAGEGSNGGAVLPPATVRDPLVTILSLVKMWAFRLDRVVAAAVGQDPPADPSFGAVVRMLPRFTTLATDDPRAKLPVPDRPHAALKAAFEAALAVHGPERVAALERLFGTRLNLEIVNYEGEHVRPGPGNRSGEQKGGLRVLFRDEAGGMVRASIWMRGSGTEPVFRILADVEGDNQTLMAELVEWHRSLLSL